MIKYKKMLLLRASSRTRRVMFRRLLLSATETLGYTLLLGAVSVSGVLLCHQPSWSNTIHIADPHLSKSAQVGEPAFKPADYSLNDCMTGQKNPVSAMAMNMVPLGLGSYQQGDIVGGVTLSTIDGLGLGILGVAAWGFMTGQSWGAAFIAPSGLALVTLGRLLGLVFPWTHVMYAHHGTCGPDSITQSSLHEQTPTGSMPIMSYSTSF